MAVGYPGIVALVSAPEHHSWHLVVLHDQPCILLVSRIFAIFRRQTQRFLANVCAPHCYRIPHVFFLDLQHDTYWQPRSTRPWLRWYLVGGGNLFWEWCAEIGNLFLFLQASKMALYSKRQRVCDTCFLFFTLTWLITRVGLFPFWIIRNTAIGAAEIVPMFPAYYIFNGLLMLLLVLHLFWTYLILKMVYKSLLVGKVSTYFENFSSVSLLQVLLQKFGRIWELIGTKI